MALTYEEIGQRLRTVRDHLGLSQTKVAKYLNVKREYISYYETGKRPIDTLTLSKLANLYGYSLSYFLGSDDKTSKPLVSAAFRAHDLSPDDLNIIAWVKKFTSNLSLINKMLGE